MHHCKKSGFTLVEMLVVAPIVILVIGGLITAIVAMTGDVLATRNANLLAYDIQDALDRMESDIRLSGGFLDENNIQPMSKQGVNNTTTKFASSVANPTLILNSYTTTTNPADSARNIVHKQGINVCGGPTEMLNDPLMMNIVYFVQDNTLWRRIIAPENYFDTINTVCSKPWQMPSCAQIYTADKYCQSKDVRLVDNIDEFKLEYYLPPDYLTLTANLSTANTQVMITITATGTAAGRKYTQTGTIRAVSINNNFES